MQCLARFSCTPFTVLVFPLKLPVIHPGNIVPKHQKYLTPSIMHPLLQSQACVLNTLGQLFVRRSKLWVQFKKKSQVMTFVVCVMLTQCLLQKFKCIIPMSKIPQIPKKLPGTSFTGPPFYLKSARYQSDACQISLKLKFGVKILNNHDNSIIHT